MKRGRGSLIAMEKDAALRQHLLDLLKAGNAHAVFQDVIKDFPAELRGMRPKDIDKVLLVGGTSKIPLIRRYVAEKMAGTPTHDAVEISETAVRFPRLK